MRATPPRMRANGVPALGATLLPSEAAFDQDRVKRLDNVTEKKKNLLKEPLGSGERKGD